MTSGPETTSTSGFLGMLGDMITSEEGMLSNVLKTTTKYVGYWSWLPDFLGGNTANKIAATASGIHNMQTLMRSAMKDGKLSMEGLGDLAGDAGEYIVRDYLSENFSWLPGPVAKAITHFVKLAASFLVQEMVLAVSGMVKGGAYVDTKTNHPWVHPTPDQTPHVESQLRLPPTPAATH